MATDGTSKIRELEQRIYTLEAEQAGMRRFFFNEEAMRAQAAVYREMSKMVADMMGVITLFQKRGLRIVERASIAEAPVPKDGFDRMQEAIATAAAVFQASTNGLGDDAAEE